MSPRRMPRPAEDSWWADLDESVLACLAEHGPMSPAELARHIGVSEPATTSLLCLLAAEGRIRIREVVQAGAEADEGAAAVRLRRKRRA